MAVEPKGNSKVRQKQGMVAATDKGSSSAILTTQADHNSETDHCAQWQPQSKV
jgi:hypothetical protein